MNLPAVPIFNRLTGICLISADVLRLCAFYETVLHITARSRDATHADLAVEGGSLTIFSVKGMEDMAPGSMNETGTGRFTLEFEVPDVDQEYARLCEMNVPMVKPPASYPWGRRSFWFRDPDGNIVNFFSSEKRSPA